MFDMQMCEDGKLRICLDSPEDLESRGVSMGPMTMSGYGAFMERAVAECAEEDFSEIGIAVVAMFSESSGRIPMTFHLNPDQWKPFLENFAKECVSAPTVYAYDCGAYLV